MRSDTSRIKYNKQFGRHLVAKRDIPADKVVLLEDVLRVADSPWECYSCSKKCMNCIACINCPDVVFCSVDCTNECKTHKLECGTIFPDLQLSDRFLIKSLLFAIISFPDVDSLMQFVEVALLEKPETLPPLKSLNLKAKYHFFFKLSTSVPYLQTKMVRTWAHKAYKYINKLPKVSCLFDSNEKKLFLMHLAMHHALISRNNTFGDEHVFYMANVTSLLNHACACNLDLTFSKSSSKRHLIGTTNRSIKKGGQIFINYEKGLGELSASERNKILKSERGFVCKCELCLQM